MKNSLLAYYVLGALIESIDRIGLVVRQCCDGDGLVRYVDWLMMPKVLLILHVRTWIVGIWKPELVLVWSGSF